MVALRLNGISLFQMPRLFKSSTLESCWRKPDKGSPSMGINPPVPTTAMVARFSLGHVFLKQTQMLGAILFSQQFDRALDTQKGLQMISLRSHIHSICKLSYLYIDMCFLKGPPTLIIAHHDSVHIFLQQLTYPVLRTYPPRFARRVAKYYNRFCTQRVGHCPKEIEDATMTTFQIINLINLDKEDDQWTDAKLIDAFLYLRGSKSLDLGEWRQVLPTSTPLD